MSGWGKVRIVGESAVSGPRCHISSLIVMSSFEIGNCEIIQQTKLCPLQFCKLVTTFNIRWHENIVRFSGDRLCLCDGLLDPPSHIFHGGYKFLWLRMITYGLEGDSLLVNVRVSKNCVDKPVVNLNACLHAPCIIYNSQNCVANLWWIWIACGIVCAPVTNQVQRRVEILDVEQNWEYGYREILAKRTENIPV